MENKKIFAFIDTSTNGNGKSLKMSWVVILLVLIFVLYYYSDYVKIYMNGIKNYMDKKDENIKK